MPCADKAARGRRRGGDVPVAIRTAERKPKRQPDRQPVTHRQPDNATRIHTAPGQHADISAEELAFTHPNACPEPYPDAEHKPLSHVGDCCFEPCFDDGGRRYDDLLYGLELYT